MYRKKSRANVESFGILYFEKLIFILFQWRILKEKIYKSIPITCPVNIPVHLLHIGTCQFFIKKLLSSLWWQPHLLPNLIKNAQVLIFVLFFIKIYFHNHYKYLLFWFWLLSLLYHISHKVFLAIQKASIRQQASPPSNPFVCVFVSIILDIFSLPHFGHFILFSSVSVILYHRMKNKTIN